MMGIDVVIVRAIHIFAGIIWVGFGMFAGTILAPAAQKLGERGSFVFQILFVHSAYTRAVAAAAVTTTVAGLYLYARVYDGMYHSILSQTGSIVLSIGALFGLLAFGHGIALGRIGNKYAEVAKAAGDEPTQEQVEEMQALGARIARNGRISMVLMIIAVVGMVLPRYL